MSPFWYDHAWTLDRTRIALALRRHPSRPRIIITGIGWHKGKDPRYQYRYHAGACAGDSHCIGTLQLCLRANRMATS